MNSFFEYYYKCVKKIGKNKPVEFIQKFLTQYRIIIINIHAQ
jgi:hypothetical protein